jgi:hypothetical protein
VTFRFPHVISVSDWQPFKPIFAERSVIEPFLLTISNGRVIPIICVKCGYKFKFVPFTQVPIAILTVVCV